MDEIKRPYPGLRPFRKDEAHLFFGREEQIVVLQDILIDVRFLAVVGTSGSGKSSLVKAGLIPALEKSIDKEGRGAVIVIRPEDKPYQNLSEALAQQDKSEEIDASDVALLHLERGSLGLIDLYKSFEFSGPLYIIIDQFEEIFAYKRNHYSEAQRFVKMLIDSSQWKEVPIYVSIVIRSEFLGRCSEFQNLPEKINDGQYLIPRLTRSELKRVIIKPSELAGGTLDQALINQLLNDVGEKKYHLPILQHSLMRIWDEWSIKGGVGTLGIREYEDIGSIKNALSDHADLVYESLPYHLQKVCGKLFKCIVDPMQEEGAVRRPTAFARIVQITGSDKSEIKAIISKFSRPECAFISSSPLSDIKGDDLVDISHESLIEGWLQLKKWVNEEKKAAQKLIRAFEDAMVRKRHGIKPMSRFELKDYNEWSESNSPNPSWGSQYLENEEDYKLTLDFLSLSKKIRIRNFLAKIFFSLVLLAGFSWGYYSWSKAEISDAETSKQVLINKNLRVLALSALTENYQKTDPTLSRRLSIALVNENVDLGWKSVLESFYFPIFNNLVCYQTKLQQEVTVSSISSIKGNDSLLVIGFENGMLHLISKRDGGTVKEILLDNRNLRALSISPDGKYLAVGGEDPRLDVLSTHDWNSVSQYEFQFIPTGDISNLAWSPDGTKILFLIGTELTIQPFSEEGENKKILVDANHEPIQTANWSADGKQVLTFSHDNSVSLWTNTGAPILTKKTEFEGITAVVWLENLNKVIVGTQKGKCIALSYPELEVLYEFEGHTGKIHQFLYNPANNLIVSCSWDKTMRLWNAENGVLMKTFSGHEKEILGITFNQARNELVSISKDKTIRVWPFGLEEQLIRTVNTDANGRTLSWRDSTTLMLHGDQNLLGNQLEDETWELSSNEGRLELKEREKAPTFYSPISFLLDSLAKDLEEGIRQQYPLEYQKSKGFQVSENSKYAIAYHDTKLNLWSNSQAEITHKDYLFNQSIHALEWSPNTSHIAIGFINGETTLWPFDKNETSYSLIGQNEQVTALSWNSIGDKIAVATANGSLWIWPLNGNKPFKLMHNGDSYPVQIKWSPYNRNLAVLFNNGRLSVFPMGDWIRDWMKTAPIYKLSDEEKREFGLDIE